VLEIYDNDNGTTKTFTMLQQRPIYGGSTTYSTFEKIPTCDTPYLTGQRVIDTFFPYTRDFLLVNATAIFRCPLGGTAAIVGGYGTGKTTLCRLLARHANSDVVVFVACGERGNDAVELMRDMSEVPFPRWKLILLISFLIIRETGIWGRRQC